MPSVPERKRSPAELKELAEAQARYRAALAKAKARGVTNPDTPHKFNRFAPTIMPATRRYYK